MIASTLRWTKIEKLPESLTMFPVFQGDLSGRGQQRGLQVLMDVEKGKLFVMIGKDLFETEVQDIVAGLVAVTQHEFKVEAYKKAAEAAEVALAEPESGSDPGPSPEEAEEHEDNE